MKNILITGGLGYIGSHIAVELLTAGYNVFIIDNFSNSKINIKSEIENITNKQVTFINADTCDKKLVKKLLKQFKIDTVVHCAGLKSIAESISQPKLYKKSVYLMTKKLLSAMKSAKVYNIIYSSSCAVYGNTQQTPIEETFQTKLENPYSFYKYKSEKAIEQNSKKWNLTGIVFRYFNVLGAHSSHKIGDNPIREFSNLMTYLYRAVDSDNKAFTINTVNGQTPDNTPIRDFVHVSDIALAHLSAIQNIDKISYQVFNISNNIGTSVKEVFTVFNNLVGNKLTLNLTPSTGFNVPISIGDNSLAKQTLSWKPKYNFEKMIESHIKFKNQIRR